MTDENGLFRGVEDAELEPDGGTVETDTREPLSEDAAVNPVAWATDLTYKEVHSFTVGFSAVLLAGVLTFISAFIAPLLAPVVTATWAAVGLLGLAALGVAKLPTKRLRYIPAEPHYYLGGAAISLMAFLAVTVPLVLVALGVEAIL